LHWSSSATAKWNWPVDSFDDHEDGFGNQPEFSVSELSFALKRNIEDAFGHVRVRGELGRVSRPGSGHIYLDLKDDKAVINGIIWKGVAQRLKIQPEQGLEVIVTGKLTTYPGQSKYQIIIESMEPAGVGALMALLEERRKKFEAEGLFDASRKKVLPYLPSVIGVVTSPTGAVIRDILHRISDRFPVHVLVWPVRVQGETSADEVARGIKGFNQLADGGDIPRPDLIIVARGGGGLEDLWGFNEEVVVRAACLSEIPLISAVGHETDWTLLDYVADERAPTPTAAAERAVPVRAELLALVEDLKARKTRGLWRVVEECKQALRASSRGLPKPVDLLGLARQRFDAAASLLPRALMAGTQVFSARLTRISSRLTPRPLEAGIRFQQERVSTLNARASRSMGLFLEKTKSKFYTEAKLLNSLSYQEVLRRGFALVRGEDGIMLRSAEVAGAQQAVEIEFHDGRLKAAVNGLTAAKPKSSKKKASKTAGSGQGNLF
jgi:exodeoxyribonuclease VII large subunit